MEQFRSIKFILNRTAAIYDQSCRRAEVQLRSFSGRHSMSLFIIGCLILLAGLIVDVEAQHRPHTITYNDERLRGAMNAVLTYLEGSFGALIMVAAGVLAIVSSAFGQYRAALGLLIVAVGSFILRSLVSTFFNDRGVQP